MIALLEDGVFQPLTDMTPTIPEGQQVRLVVEPMPDVLELATRVYEGLSDLEIDEIEAVALDRRGFFGPKGDRVTMHPSVTPFNEKIQLS